MFKKKDKLDIEGLNEVIFISKKILRIGFIFAIIALVFLITCLVKEWYILRVIKDLLVVISPIFIGLIIAWLFDPIVKWLQSKNIPKIVACILVYVVVIGGISLFVSLLMPTFINQIKDFASTIPSLLKNFKDIATNLFNNFSSNHDIDLSSMKETLFGTIETFGINITTKVPNALVNVAKSLVSGGMTFILGLMIGFYMLFDFDKVSQHVLEIMPSGWRENAKDLCRRINQSLRGYVQGVFFVMLLVFVTQSIGLSLAGLKAPLVFALFCALMDIIPYFGPYIGAIPAVIVGFTQSPIVGVFCIVSIVVVQILENNFYQPLIMGHTMKLHPVTIMIGLLIFQHFFGIIGMIVATPVIAALKVIFTFINEKLNVVGMIQGEEKEI